MNLLQSLSGGTIHPVVQTRINTSPFGSTGGILPGDLIIILLVGSIIYSMVNSGVKTS